MKHTNIRHKTLKGARRVVVKVGSSVLVERGIGLDLVIFAKLAKEISRLQSSTHKVVLVSSGAIAAGMEQLQIKKRPDSIPQFQASAAIGQPYLMKIYQDCFSTYHQKVAQVLLTHEDLSNRHRYLNARNTLLTLLNLGFIPIVNENDTVAVEEIKFGDNDNLSALVTTLVNADLLVILSDIDGLYDQDPRNGERAKLIPVVENIDREIVDCASATQSPCCVGGMASKIEAVRKAARFGVATVVANGRVDHILDRILGGEDVGTLFLPVDDRLSSRKHWIAYNLKPVGGIIVDQGARDAIVSNGKSLLPTGVIEIQGRFERGDSASLLDIQRNEFARGLVNYNWEELGKIRGKKSREIESILGYRYYDEIIHRDDLVVL